MIPVLMKYVQWTLNSLRTSFHSLKHSWSEKFPSPWRVLITAQSFIKNSWWFGENINICPKQCSSGKNLNVSCPNFVLCHGPIFKIVRLLFGLCKVYHFLPDGFPHEFSNCCSNGAMLILVSRHVVGNWPEPAVSILADLHNHAWGPYVTWLHSCQWDGKHLS